MMLVGLLYETMVQFVFNMEEPAAMKPWTKDRAN